jgi:hypothetical protein
MASNLNKLAKIASILDKSGKYSISDKIDNLIKTSQYMPTQATELPSTGAPQTGNPLIDGMFQNMSDTAAGNFFAGGGMYDMSSPYKSEFGPSGPSVTPYISPKKLAELLKTEAGRKYVAQLQMSSALKNQQFSNLNNQGMASIGKFVAQNLAPGVPQERQREFLNNILPTIISDKIAIVLQTFPIPQWDSRLAEFSAIANQNPQYSNQIKNLVNSSVKSALNKIKYSNEKQYAKITSDPKYKDFSTKFNV